MRLDGLKAVTLYNQALGDHDVLWLIDRLAAFSNTEQL